jgi:hypothetical protein
MCCGQKRTQLRNSQTQWTTPSAPPYSSGNNQAQAGRSHPPTAPTTQKTSPQQPANPQTRSIQPQVATATSTHHHSISVRYLERSPIRVRGLVSGMSYEFSGSRPVQQVDARDASSLLNTRFFRRAS